MKINQKIFLSSLAFLLAGNSAALAAGYSTNLTSTSGLGNSYAGSVTGIHDASDVFFNPSVSAEQKESQFIASASYLRLKIDADKIKSSSPYTGSVSGGDVRNAGQDAVVPAFYLSTPINDKATFAFAVTSPFGLATKYKSNWAGRYQALESSISTTNFNPSVSYKITDAFSVGAGLQAQYYWATLTNSAENPGNGDGFAKLKGSDWGYGYNLGANFKADEQLKFGIGYRSKIEHKLTGREKALGSGLGNLYSNFIAKTTTPESLTVGTAFKATPKFELAYDTTWTRWSRLNKLTVIATQNSNLNSTSSFKMGDSFLHSLGANFTLNNKWLLRTGLAYEKEAITDAGREPRIPVGSKTWLSAGFSYKLSDSSAIDGAYVHQFYNPAKMNHTDANSYNTIARYQTNVDVISLAFKTSF